MQGAQSTQPSFAVWRCGAGVLPWMQSQEHETVKRGHAAGKTCTYSVLSLSPAEGHLRDSRLLHAGLVPLPVGLICAGCFWIVQEHSQLRWLAYRNHLSSAPLVLMPVHLCFSVLPSFPFASVSTLCLCLDKMKADSEVSKLPWSTWNVWYCLTRTPSSAFAYTVFVFVGPLKGISPGLKGFWRCFPRSQQDESTVFRLLGKRKKSIDTSRLSVPTKRENLSLRQVKNNHPSL